MKKHVLTILIGLTVLGCVDMKNIAKKSESASLKLNPDYALIAVEKGAYNRFVFCDYSESRSVELYAADQVPPPDCRNPVNIGVNFSDAEVRLSDGRKFLLIALQDNQIPQGGGRYVLTFEGIWSPVKWRAGPFEPVEIEFQRKAVHVLDDDPALPGILRREIPTLAGRVFEIAKLVNLRCGRDEGLAKVLGGGTCNLVD